MTPPKTTLRMLRDDDLVQVRQWRNHPEVRRYMYTRHEIGETEHRAWFQRAQEDPHRHLLLAERNGYSYGFVNIQLDDAAAQRATWGFYLAPKAPRGSGQALGVAALRHAFVDLGLHKLCGESLAGNDRSLRFHERLGFTREAHLRDHHFDGHSYHDVIGFGLLRSEWQALQGA